MTPNEDYWRRVRARAKALGSDGCTLVDEWLQDCCFEHDVHRRTGLTINGMPISVIESDYVYRHCMEQRVSLRFLHPRSWLRWAGVRIGAWRDRQRKG